MQLQKICATANKAAYVQAMLNKSNTEVKYLWCDAKYNIILLESDLISPKNLHTDFTSQNLQDYNLFPDLYWLFDPHIVKTISKLETQGITKKLQARLAEDADFRAEFLLSNLDFKLRRQTRLRIKEQNLIASHSLTKIFHHSNIAGTKDDQAVKCLHAHYAHYLVAKGNNPVGKYLVENFDLPKFDAF